MSWTSGYVADIGYTFGCYTELNPLRGNLAFLNTGRDWHPMHFADMADWLEPARLQYACSAHYMDHMDGINLTEEQQTLS